MAQVLEFYVAGGEPIRTSNYVLKTISTPKGKRKQAVATYKGRKLYKFVSMSFKK